LETGKEFDQLPLGLSRYTMFPQRSASSPPRSAPPPPPRRAPPPPPPPRRPPPPAPPPPPRGARPATWRAAPPSVRRGACGACAGPRRNSSGTWLTPAMLEAYGRLHDLGLAHSVEAWHYGELVGGLYGVALGRVFFGESMFSHMTDASKVAFVHFVRQLQDWG